MDARGQVERSREVTGCACCLLRSRMSPCPFSFPLSFSLAFVPPPLYPFAPGCSALIYKTTIFPLLSTNSLSQMSPCCNGSLSLSKHNKAMLWFLLIQQSIHQWLRHCVKPEAIRHICTGRFCDHLTHPYKRGYKKRLKPEKKKKDSYSLKEDWGEGAVNETICLNVTTRKRIHNV